MVEKQLKDLKLDEKSKSLEKSHLQTIYHYVTDKHVNKDFQYEDCFYQVTLKQASHIVFQNCIFENGFKGYTFNKKCPPSLRHASFEDCKISQDQAEGIIELFCQFGSLEEVNFKGNQFESQSGLTKRAKGF